MIENYLEFIYDGYLESNFTPLYHRTTTFSLFDIITENVLKMTKFENIYKDRPIKMVSLTRNKNLKIDYYKPFLDVNIQLDRDKLMKKYKIIPYDFFIHNKIDTNAKSNIKRIEPFEFEEIILKNITNIMDYILSIDFEDNSIMDRQVASILPKIRNKNIKIYNNGEEY